MMPVPFVSPDSWRVTPITPFTYRDGLTYLEVLEALRARDVELVDMINDGLDKAAADLNKAVAALWDELQGPLARITEFEGEMELKFAELEAGVEKALAVFQAQCLKIIDEALRDPDIELFSWHTGKTEHISRIMRDADNHYTPLGLTAGDYTRKHWTAQELEDMPHSVEWMAYRGKLYGSYANPLKATNESTGYPTGLRAASAAMARVTVSAANAYDGGSTNIECDSIDFTASSAPLRKVS